MPTVLDSFTVEIGLDASKFAGGQKAVGESLKKMIEGTDKGAKEIESHGKRIGEFFSTAKRSIVEVGALLVGGIGLKEFVGHVAQADAQVGRLSNNLNMDVRELSAWQGAARRAGGSAEGITGILKKFSTETNQFLLTGQSGILPLLRSLGIGFYDANKRLKEPGEQIMEIVAALEKSRMTMPQKRAFLQMFGADEDTISFLLRGTGAVKKLMDEARAAGVTTRESAAAADQYNKALVSLDDSATNLWRTLVTSLGPALTFIMDVASGSVGVFGKLLDLFTKITASVPTLVRHLTVGATDAEKAEAEKKHRLNLGKMYKEFGEPDDEAGLASRKTISRLFGEASATRIFGTKEEDDAARKADAADRKAMIREYEESLLAKKKQEEQEDLARKRQGTPQPSPTSAGHPPQPSPAAGLTTITTVGGKSVTVSGASASDFKGILDEMERKGAPIGDLVGYNNRNIAGTSTPSEHSKGLAVDLGSMSGRDQIDPALRSWIESHSGEWREMLQRFHMRSGGDFKNPDLGHIEWRGIGRVGESKTLKPDAVAPPETQRRPNMIPGAPSAAVTAGAGRQAGSNTSTSSTMNVQHVSVTLPGVHDADAFAQEIGPALKRMSFAAGVNSSLV